MDAEQFAKGFERDPRDYAKLSGQAWRSARDELIDPPIRWSHFFSHLMDGYLTGNSVDIDDANKNIGLYTGNSTRHLLRNITETTERATFYKPALAPHLNRMNFHTMNQEMGDSWRHLLDPEANKPLDYINLVAVQTRLAVHALRLVETRRRFYDDLMMQEPAATHDEMTLDQSFVGRITEIDAAITLLQVVKTLPIDEVEHLTVLPAPGKYEGYKGKSSDFLMIDTEQWQAHGIQVKTRVWNPADYDPAYVSFIDGTVDLGNYKEKDLPDGRVKRQAVPGLISADYLLHDEDIARYSSFSRIPEFSGLFGPIYHARETARTMQVHMDGSQRVAKAAAVIGPRLLQALHATPPDTQKEPGESPSSKDR